MPTPPAGASAERPTVSGKFLRLGPLTYWVRGATYGTFRPDAQGGEFHDPAAVERDLVRIAANGFNAIRTYTVPPRWLLDAAHRWGLRVMVGIAWEEHVAFLDYPRLDRVIEDRVRVGVRACAGHPAVLCYAIGSEIPAAIVRWHGHRRVEAFLERLYRAAKDEDPTSLVTYVNYPSTEYLDLPFLDLFCFNVYLESEERLQAYLARLQNLARDRPLVLAEVGLDSRRHGLDAQARTLEWQIRSAYAAGCAGAFVFAWTDEWHRGGHDITDWDFGLVDRRRRPKPALAAARDAFAEVPFPPAIAWPRVSVIVCSYNGARTIGECLAGLRRLEYPNFEVVVISDGSKDRTAAIAEEHGYPVIETPNRGLSSARNTGLQAAAGEIVAYIDDDAYPDPHWLTYLAATFRSTEHVAVGGPNLPVPSDGPVAQCVANAPGGPVHVLLSDGQAEHIPGCNMAFRKRALQAIGGFDPLFRTAGDDVDVCWRLQERGWTIGFSPAAVVWHHRRGSVRGYWRQQLGYGRAEALLERKWPEKYNAAGHLTWAGRLYGHGLARLFNPWRSRVYHGVWGCAPFQSIYAPAAGPLLSLFLMPEWYLVIAAVGAVGALGVLWPPLLFAWPAWAAATAGPLALAALGAMRASFAGVPRSRAARLKLRALTALLHILQPAARLKGRLTSGLTPWRGWAIGDRARPWPRTFDCWSEWWQPPEAWLGSVEARLRAAGGRTRRGGEFDRWDLEVRAGVAGAARMRMGIEEHGGGRQMARFRIWPRIAPAGAGSAALLAILAAAAARDGARGASVVLVIGAALVLAGALRASGAAMATLLRALPPRGGEEEALEKAKGSAVAAGAVGGYGKLAAYALGQWPALSAILGLTAAGSAAAALQPWPLKLLVDHALGGRPVPAWLASTLHAFSVPVTSSVLVIVAAVASVLMFMVGIAATSSIQWAWAVVGQRMMHDLAADLFARLQRLSLLFHGRRSVGDMLDRLSGDNWCVQTLTESLLVWPARHLLTLVTVGAVAWRLDAGMAALSLGVIPLLAGSGWFFGRRLKRRQLRQRQFQSRLTSFVHTTLASAPLVHAFDAAGRNGEHFDRLAGELSAHVRRQVTSQQAFTLVNGFLTTTGVAVILYAGGLRVMAGALSAGGLLVLVAYVRSMQGALRGLLECYGGVKSAAASAERVLEIMGSAEEVVEARGAREVGRARGEVRLEGVTFGYEPGRPVLREVSLSAEPGEVVGLVGTTGAGKSTLVSLIPRFFDPWEGRVLLDGEDVRELRLRDVRAQVGLMLQEPFLLPLTVAENIAYGRPEARGEEIEAAARAARAHEFIARLPRGYETVVGERGATLSGGERQRVAIARAVLRDAPMLILDEPTAALDLGTEALVLEALEHLMRGRTTLVIAHRLSTLRKVDRIVVLEEGRIVEQGRPAELLAARGRFWRLHRLQFASGPPPEEAA